MIGINILKFAALISWLTKRFGEAISEGDAETILKMTTDMVEAPPAIEFNVIEMPNKTAPTKIDPGEFNNFLNFLLDAHTKNKIVAIKMYRELTGADLTEAKNTVEYYWNRIHKDFEHPR